MVYFIKEEDTVLGSAFEVVNRENEVIQHIASVGFKKEYKGYTYFCITNLNGIRFKEASRYINYILFKSTYKKKELAFTALKLLHSFIQLYQINDIKKDINKESVRKLIDFLEGGEQLGYSTHLNLKTRRANSTVNTYLSVYRDFFAQVFNITDSPFNEKTSVGRFSGGGLMGHANQMEQERYTINKKIKLQMNIPQYIKLREYQKIMDLINSEYGAREKAIVKLMYEYSLRIGEALGLTIEDVEEADYGDYKIVLRNRKSDHPFQQAKSLMKINSYDDYSDKLYSSEGVGYDTIIIDEEMYEIIEDYIYETRDEFLLNKSPKKKANLESKALADKATDRGDIETNQYIFLNNQHYTPLTQSGWNYTLRKIFKQTGIVIDKNNRENNLNHRFRHGFAMNMVKRGAKREEVAKALRHSSISSVIAYYNPDEEDKAEILKKNRSYMEKGGYNFE